MYVIAVTAAGAYIILFFCSRREEAGRCAFAEKFFKKSAIHLYKKLSLSKNPIFSDKRVEKDLMALNPGGFAGELCKEYYVRKIMVLLELCFAGTVIALLVQFNSRENTVGYELPRGNFEEGERKYTLTTNDNDLFELTLEPFLYDEAEARELYARFQEELLQKVFGKGEAIFVDADMVLLTELEGYPFLVEWESELPDVINDLGEVAPVTNSQKVILYYHTYYEDMEWMDQVEVTVLPPNRTDEEMRQAKIQELLDETEENTRKKKKFALPERYLEEELSWKQKKEDQSVAVWVIIVFLALAIFFMKDRDLHAELEKRRKAIKHEYADIVQKLALYMGAGMTARNAFKKLALDYERKIKQEGGRNPAMDEILYSYRELLSGVSEPAVYEHLGLRTGVQEYIRLGTLLQQNMKKGNAEILSRLREEADSALAEKIQSSRRMGEEAGTKLLLPMVLMLLVVMVIVMMPAFMSSSL